MKKLLVFAIAILGFSAFSFAQNSVTQSVSASAKIITPLVFAKTSDLAFGNVVPGTTAGNVVISNATTPGTRTPDATITCWGAFSNAGFTVRGDESTTYSVGFPTTVTLNGPTPATPLVATLSCNIPATNNTTKATNSPFYIGASLAIGIAGAQTIGQYSGTFNVTVAYE